MSTYSSPFCDAYTGLLKTDWLGSLSYLFDSAAKTDTVHCVQQDLIYAFKLNGGEHRLLYFSY